LVSVLGEFIELRNLVAGEVLNVEPHADNGSGPGDNWP
jgi:hypothetical protein